MDTLLYDGACGLCSQTVALLHRLRPRGVAVVAYQQADVARLGLTRTECDAALQWVAAGGGRRSGSDALAVALRRCPLPWRLAGIALGLPPLRQLARPVYRAVARRRHRWPYGPTSCPRP